MDNPKDEYACEETGHEVLLLKDNFGPLIDFEKLSSVMTTPQPIQVAFEAVEV